MCKNALFKASIDLMVKGSPHGPYYSLYTQLIICTLFPQLSLWDLIVKIDVNFVQGKTHQGNDYFLNIVLSFIMYVK